MQTNILHPIKVKMLEIIYLSYVIVQKYFPERGKRGT